MNNYTIISSSTRKNSESLRVSKVIQSIIHENDLDSVINILNLAEIKHMEWNESFWEEEVPCAEWKNTSKLLTSSSAIIFVVPEWHGMIPPALLNLLILSERNELAHKPALIVGVSSGTGGAYIVSQLKGHYSKNNRLCFIPEQVIIRNVRTKLFNGDENSEGDYARLQYATAVLKAYIPALRQVRDSGVLDYKSWPYGM